MRFEAITRKSSFLATVLATMVVAASLVRASYTPYSIEIAEFPYSERVLSKIIAAFLVLVGSILTGRLFVRTGLSKNYCTLPIPIYTILACGIAISPHTLSSAAVAMLFALALLLIATAVERDNDINRLFVGAILLGTLPLISPQCIVLFAVILAVWVLFTLPVRAVVAMAVGWALPLFAASYIMWYAGDSIFSLGESLWLAISQNHTPEIGRLPYGAIPMVATILVIVIGGFAHLSHTRNEVLLMVRVRRQLLLFAATTVIALAMFLLPSYSLTPLVVVAAPLSIVMSFILSATPTNSSTISYWVLLIATIIHLFIE